MAAILLNRAALIVSRHRVTVRQARRYLQNGGRSVVSAMQAAHAIANAAIERLGPNDLAAVVYTGRASRKYSQGLTADRARLHAAANLLSVNPFDVTAAHVFQQERVAR